MKLMIALLFLVFAGCNTSNRSAGGSEELLTKNTWILKTIYQQTDTLRVTDPVAFLHFDTTKKTAGGKGGCNSYGSQYSLDKERVNFSNSYSTKMYCKEFQHIEDKYFEALAKVNRYQVSSLGLVLYNGEQPLLEFVKK